MEFRYNLLIPIYWVIFIAIKSCCYLCLWGWKAFLFPFPESSHCPISPLLKAKSYLYALPTSPLFSFSLKHISVRFAPHQSINAAPVSHQ